METAVNPNTDLMNFTFSDPNSNFFVYDFDPFMETFMSDCLASNGVVDQEDSFLGLTSCFFDSNVQTNFPESEITRLLSEEISSCWGDNQDQEGSSSSAWNTLSSSEKIFQSTSPASSVVSTPNLKNEPIRKEKKRKEKERKQSIGFRVKSNLDVLDDGYRWRKYGKKPIKDTPFPRHYHKCSQEGCNVKKKVERDREDPSYLEITYDGIHNHDIPSVVYCEADDVSSFPNSLVFTGFPSS